MILWREENGKNREGEKGEGVTPLTLCNDKGNTNLLLKVGGEYAKNKHEKFTVHLDVGSAGNLVCLNVTTPEGRKLARVQVFPDGKIEAQNINITLLKKGIL
ncbi:MAG: hypothetical protein MRJ65_05290 [Candidatus Brocadiaceae bacterium]|nr:hypothetical protein [Candidatus Brocadiaceae bacterium]